MSYHGKKHEVRERHVSRHSPNLTNEGIELLADAGVILAKRLNSVGFETPRTFVTKSMESEGNWCTVQNSKPRLIWLQKSQAYISQKARVFSQSFGSRLLKYSSMEPKLTQ